MFLPGSVYMLLASNFGALKGYLIAGTAFFGFMIMLSAVWLFGLPGTTPLTGPKGPQPTFVPFTIDDPAASTYDSVRDFQGGAGNGWQPAPEGEVEEGSPEATLQADLDTARQAAVSDLIEETNQDIEDSSEELDATNVEAKTFYTIQDGTEVAAIVISPADPAGGLGPPAARLRPRDQLRLPRPGQPVPAQHPVPGRLGGAVRGPPVPARPGRAPPPPGRSPRPRRPRATRQPAGAGAAARTRPRPGRPRRARRSR